MKISPRIQEILERLEETRGMYYNLARPSAEILFVLARLTRPKEIVEVGTSNGYASIILGAAVQPFGGRVATIERDGELVEEARKNILDAGLQDVVTVHPGSAYKVLKQLPGPFSFVFLDATKQEYEGYLERIRPKLAPRALLTADNILSHREELLSFTENVIRDDRFSATVLPIGMGLLVGVYEPQSQPNPDRPIPSMEELVAHASQRIFRGTAQEVRNGGIFARTRVSSLGAAAPGRDPTLDGYEDSLAEEAERLPEE